MGSNALNVISTFIRQGIIMVLVWCLILQDYIQTRACITHSAQILVHLIKQATNKYQPIATLFDRQWADCVFPSVVVSPSWTTAAAAVGYCSCPHDVHDVVLYYTSSASHTQPTVWTSVSE